MGVEHNDVDHDLQWYIVGSFHNPRFANEGVAEGSESSDNLVSTLNSFGYYSDNGDIYVNDSGDKIARQGSNWKHQSGKRGIGAEELGEFLGSKQGVAEAKKKKKKKSSRATGAYFFPGYGYYGGGESGESGGDGGGESVEEVTKQSAIKQYQDIQNYKDKPSPKQDDKEFVKITINRPKKAGMEESSDSVQKQKEWHHSSASDSTHTVKSFAYQGYTIKFKSDIVEIYLGSDMVYSRPGDFSNPTKSQLAGMHLVIGRLVDKKSRGLSESTDFLDEK
jgi:hypothetical protein